MDPETSKPAAAQINRDNYNEDETGIHEGFMREALAMAELALATNETPVGCVFVHNGTIIGRGMNATNRTMNGTRHAEFIAIASILSSYAQPQSSSPSTSTSPSPSHSHITSPTPQPSSGPSLPTNTATPSATPKKLYSASILQESDLYVTVEPCIMCASLLRQYRIRKVYFGASNERFGGTGGVLRIHEGGPGEGGPEKGFEVSGGWLREEAIMLLRRFYVQENSRAPEPRSKKDRTLKTEIEPLVRLEGDAG